MSQWIIDNVKGAGVWAVEIIQFSTVSFKITGQRTVHDSDKDCARGFKRQPTTRRQNVFTRTRTGNRLMRWSCLKNHLEVNLKYICFQKW